MTQEPGAPETVGDTDPHGSDREAAAASVVVSHDDDTAARVAESPTAQSELDLGVVSTGSAEIDHALRPLESLNERPVADHADAYEQVLGDLTAAMSDPAATPPSHQDDGHDDQGDHEHGEHGDGDHDQSTG